MSGKFTPSSWVAFISGDVIAVGVPGGGKNMDRIIHWSGFDACHVPLEQQVANAHLIASSPDMYVALKSLLRAYDEERQAIDVSADPGCLECTSGTTPNHLNTGPCAFHRARAAISKAESHQ